MDLIVVDDSKRPDKAVVRPGMGPLVAVGGMCVPSAAIRPLTLALEQMCDEYGFPASEEFKWSPAKDSWMRENLRGGTRAEFHVDCLRAAARHGARACVVIEDEGRRSTSGRSDDHELDAVKLFLERCHSHLEDTGSEAIVLADHPSGGRPAEAEFVAACLRTLRGGTGYVMPTGSLSYSRKTRRTAAGRSDRRLHSGLCCRGDEVLADPLREPHPRADAPLGRRPGRRLRAQAPPRPPLPQPVPLAARRPGLLQVRYPSPDAETKPPVRE
jgi:hypothetical protein